MFAIYNVCRVEKTDDKYLKIMSSVPNAEKYDLFTVDNVLFVPLDQVYDLMKVQPDPDTVSRQQAIDAICDELDSIDHVPQWVFERLTKKVKNLSPSPSRPTGYWMRMSDLNESEDDRYKCSCCGNVVHHRDKVFLYTYNSWCGACGANMNAKNYVAYIQGNRA